MIHGQFLVGKDKLLHYQRIINLTKRVYSIIFIVLIFSAEKARITAAGGFVDFGRVNGIVFN